MKRNLENEIVEEILKEFNLENNKENYVCLLTKICKDNNIVNIKRAIKKHRSVSKSVSN